MERITEEKKIGELARILSLIAEEDRESSLVFLLKSMIDKNLESRLSKVREVLTPVHPLSGVLEMMETALGKLPGGKNERVWAKVVNDVFANERRGGYFHDQFGNGVSL